MAKRSYRSGRIGEEIKRIISDMLLRELTDPGFSGFVNVTGVKAADDGSFATVYVTMLGSNSGAEATEDEKKDVLRAFERAKGLIRREIGTRMKLRRTPDLQFRFDTSGEYGRYIEKLIGALDMPGGSSDPEAEAAGNPSNVTAAELAEVIAQAGSVYVFPHENMDGDTFGSSVALCLALKALGKKCGVIINEKIPDILRFIENGCAVFSDNADGWDEEISARAGEEGRRDGSSQGYPDLAIMADVGEATRLSGGEALFYNAAVTVCIDHHAYGKADCDYNLIDVRASATSEIVYELLQAMGVPADGRIAEALYVGLVTDTGRFQYSNTTEKTHRIAAELLTAGVSPNKVSAEIYQSFRPEKLYLEHAVMGTMTVVSEGKGVIAHMTREMLAQTGALEEETEGIAEKLRSIRGVEVSAFIRETGDGRTKGSLRAKSYYNVAALAERFGGGGHTEAAGFSSQRPLSEVLADMNAILEETL
ncbi:MAG: 30S ribosome-binding factor RbfA [Clostridiales Family XIII bacterium]|jgi:phosphoesterase RecJ-like protein|nr:30S ribosome-binding factor RbfA [Clostridiales Family XIII bacterium]